MSKDNEYQSSKVKLEDVRKLFQAVPFGNSNLQDEVFVLGGEDQNCPWTKARTAAVNLSSKLDSMEHNLYARKKAQLQCELKRVELKEKIQDAETEADKIRIQIEELELEKLEAELDQVEHLFVDCKEKIDLFYNHLLQAKTQIEDRGEEFTKVGYDKHARNAFEKRLIRQGRYQFLGSGRVSEGTLSSLGQLGLTIDFDARTGHFQPRQLGTEELKQLNAPSILDREQVDMLIDQRVQEMKQLEQKQGYKINKKED